MKLYKFALLICLISLLINTSTATALSPNTTTFQIGAQATLSTSDWGMTAANPQRTSWVSGASNEIRGNLAVEWYRVFDPYIDNKVQVIASDNKVFVSTSKGLYAFNASDGSQAWVYGTEMPLGNSPTFYNGVLYVGGYDHKIHAVNSSNGTVKAGWAFYEAGAGYETNPLVISDSYTGNQPVVLAGNRDGYFYALDGNNGSLKWKFQTGGPIRFSAAYKNGVVYFAADDSYAYALNVSNGSQVWKSAKLPGAGFDNYWPVIFTDPNSGKDYVIYSGSKKADWGWLSSGGQSLYFQENYDMYASQAGCPGTTTRDCSVISNYMAAHPWKRHLFILDRNSGAEYTPYAPVNWAGVTHNGNKHPPIVGGDGQLYSFIGYNAKGNNGANGWIARWKIGSSTVDEIYDSNSGAADEPVTFTGGGNLIYWGEGVNADAWGTLDLTQPVGSNHYAWQSPTSFPGARAKYTALDLTGKFGGPNGVYGYFDGLSNQSPVPYNNKLYLINGNALFALSTTGGEHQLPTAQIPSTQASGSLAASQQDTQQRLANEIQKMLAAGHLRPGYADSGIPSGYLNMHDASVPGNHLGEYFHNPADTLYTLSIALPYLSPTLQAQVKTYLQQEEANYPVESIAYIGWKNGASREAFDDPPEMQAIFSQQTPNQLFSADPRSTIWYGYLTGVNMGSFPQDSFYGAWKYAQVFPDQAKTLFDNMSGKLQKEGVNNNLTDAIFIKYPYILNQFIAGYRGYLELEKMAGYTTDITNSAQYAEYTRLLNLRINNFSKDAPLFPGEDYNNNLSVARNFMFMVPELADALRASKLTQVQQALNEYQTIEPYWFVSRYDRTFNEGVFQPLYDYPALFQAKAYILKQPYTELVKYLDVPAFGKGDLFYIQNLVALLQASGAAGYVISGNAGVDGAILTYTDGGPQFVTADGGGNYSITVPAGWSGTITPHKIGYAFTPPSTNYSTVQGNQTGQNYTASICPSCADRDTVGVFRPSNGLLYLKNLNITGFADVAINYGLAGDYPVVGDWDGDGTATIGIYRNGSFYLRNSNTLGFADMVFAFGQPGDQPIAGDWDGNGTDTIGVYRPSTGQFLLRNSNDAGPAEKSFYLGNVGDVGIAGDWTNKGFDTVGVFRPSNGIIFLKNTNETGFADIALNYGIPGDKPVVGDWDNNGTDTIGVYRGNTFYLRNSNTVGFADMVFSLGIPGDMPIAGNWDAIPAPSPPSGPSAIAISNVSDNGSVAKYDKEELTFNVSASASNPQLPFDPLAPAGVNGSEGVSVDAVFTSPTGKVWNQPGFYYAIFDDQVKGGREWFYPTGQAAWKVRFSPDEVGTWQYYLQAQDKTGTAKTGIRSFTVTASSNHGFIKASKTDPRYFEYSDGTYFPALGINSGYNEIQWTNPSANQDFFQKTGSNGIQVVRMWLSQWSIFGSSWNPWYSIRNDYDYYVPRAGLVTNGVFSSPMDQMRLVYANNNSYYFDACRFIGGFQAPPAVKQNTKYHIKIRYKAQGISGPRDGTYPGYGLVAKVQNPNDGNWHTNCYNGGDPQNGVKVTGYGKDSPNWTYLEGEWTSGTQNFLPIFYLALENANDTTATVNGQPWNWHPEVDIDTVFIGEDLGNGNYGPNIVTKPSMEHLSYYMERNAYAFDKALDLAKQNGVYLKLVVMEKNEQIENEIGFDGSAVTFDNNNFYGNYRTMTPVRWYQQAWWRYLQARWGYSPNIFSFEAVNEALPGYTNHYGQVDEMGKYLHCGVFGVSVPPYDGQKCNLAQPDAHMVSTSFTSGFERDLFASSKYPNIDYADIHQYIPKDTDLTHFQDTALSTYDLGSAYGANESGSGKPIIRGETGLINQVSNTDSMADVSADTQGIWLHNLIWGSINPTGLIDNYWYAKDHIYKTVDLRGQFKNYYIFINDIPLNNGKYIDASAVTSDPKIRAWGQKDLTNQKAHLWIANTDHVWTNTGAITPINGTVTIGGFTANTPFSVEWWDTYTGAPITTQAISTNANGELTLRISNLTTDTAVKISRQAGSLGILQTFISTVLPSLTPAIIGTEIPPVFDTATAVPATATNMPTDTATPTDAPSSTSTPIFTPAPGDTTTPTP